MASAFLELSCRALESLGRFFGPLRRSVGLWSNLSYSFGRWRLCRTADKGVAAMTALGVVKRRRGASLGEK